ncbi:MAG: hypothetical protein HYT82_02530 [Candidatus Harrisonbacteria bacterium]|nr:hypothetical protein [Candidatus Harrisonbacteria bacterium]
MTTRKDAGSAFISVNIPVRRQAGAFFRFYQDEGGQKVIACIRRDWQPEPGPKPVDPPPPRSAGVNF